VINNLNKKLFIFDINHLIYIYKNHQLNLLIFNTIYIYIFVFHIYFIQKNNFILLNIQINLFIATHIYIYRCNYFFCKLKNILSIYIIIQQILNELR